MTLSLHDVSVPVFRRALTNLSAILDKGRAFADERAIPHSDLLEARLAPDMLTLVGQIQRATDTAKFVPVRVAQTENLVMPDEEKTFDDLRSRIDRTMAFLAAVAPESFAGREAAAVELQLRSGPVPFTGTSYVIGFALPNFFFHVTTAYAILRHKGVPIGKMDFLGRP